MNGLPPSEDNMARAELFASIFGCSNYKNVYHENVFNNCDYFSIFWSQHSDDTFAAAIFCICNGFLGDSIKFSIGGIQKDTRNQSPH